MCISPFLWLLNGLYFFSDELYKLADHLYCQEAKKEDWCDEVKKKEGSKEPQKRQAKNKATRFFFFFFVRWLVRLKTFPNGKCRFLRWTRRQEKRSDDESRTFSTNYPHPALKAQQKEQNQQRSNKQEEHGSVPIVCSAQWRTHAAAWAWNLEGWPWRGCKVC